MHLSDSVDFILIENTSFLNLHFIYAHPRFLYTIEASTTLFM